ncbi:MULTISPECIES: YcaO-like family protein [Streptomyces]|uniref:YcaO-like family protein n=1 Tax=Streptomyces TaxID=1883 RepID=UPI00384D83E4
MEQHQESLLTHRVLLDWIPARPVADGAETLVPEHAVRLGRTVHNDWRLHLPSASTNGLASGNTRAEAIVHGPCEVIERDVLSALTGPGLLGPAHRCWPRRARCRSPRPGPAQLRRRH